jgi:hypothetical protein
MALASNFEIFVLSITTIALDGKYSDAQIILSGSPFSTQNSSRHFLNELLSSLTKLSHLNEKHPEEFNQNGLALLVLIRRLGFPPSFAVTTTGICNTNRSTGPHGPASTQSVRPPTSNT